MRIPRVTVPLIGADPEDCERRHVLRRSRPLQPDQEAKAMAGVLTVVAKIYPKPGRETEIEALLVKMAAAVRQHEPGCLVYRPHRSTGEPIIFYFYEQYRTDAAFEHHRTAPHLAGYRGEMKELVARPTEIELYRSLTA
jgi:quinol monooxygenase YgiN